MFINCDSYQTGVIIFTRNSRYKNTKQRNCKLDFDDETKITDNIIDCCKYYKTLFVVSDFSYSDLITLWVSLCDIAQLDELFKQFVNFLSARIFIYNELYLQGVIIS